MGDLTDRLRFIDSQGRPVGDPSQSWFGPSQALQPVAPEGFGFRAYDYPVAANLQMRPKTRPEDGFTYSELRGIARECDEVQICIQTVVDRISQCGGFIVDKGKDIETRSPRAKAVDEAFQRPDGAASRQDFISRLTREHCVTDSAAVWIDHDNSRAVVIDGTTIFPRINYNGEIVGFQQIIKGLPAKDFGLDEIIWMPKNRRSDGLFGVSPLEQCAHAALLAIRRKASQMSFFTEGTIPALLIESPEHWNSAQTKQANRAWAQMRKGTMGDWQSTWIPNGSKPYPMDRDPSKSEFDEWVIRQVCGAFNVSPSAYVKETNRATAGSLQDAALAEGHRSMMAWMKQFLDKVIATIHGPGLEWVWVEEAKIDPAILVDLAKSGIVKPAALYRLGLKASEIIDDYSPAPKMLPGQEEPKKLEAPKKKDDKKVENADIEGDFEMMAQTYLDKLLEKAQGIARELPSKVSRRMLDDDPAFGLRAVQPLHDSALAGASAAKVEFPSSSVVSDIEKPSLAFARARAAELVGRKWVDGELVDNPDAQWSIAEVVRERLNKILADGINQNMTGEQIAQAIAADPVAFGPARSRNIARYEVANAQEEGKMHYLRKAGYTRKTWSDQDGCSICVANSEDGAIPLDRPFSSGHFHAPAHPNCRCTIIPAGDAP